VRLDWHQFQQVECGAAAARVVMVEGSEILRRQALIGVKSCGADCGKEARLDVVGRVVFRQTSH